MEVLLNLSNSSVYRRPFSDVSMIVTSSILLPLCAFGIVANLITMSVIAKSEKLKTTFNYMIMSLCVSDLMSAMISPLFLYRRTWGFDEWNASGFMCKLIWAVDIWTSYVTSTHILLFAVIRFISVKWPAVYYKIKSIHVKATIATIWFATFFIGFVPFIIWFESKTRDRQSDAVDAKWPACTLSIEWVSAFRLYSVVAYSIMYYFPMLMLLVLSIAITYVLFDKRKRRESIIGRAGSSPQRQPRARLEARRRTKENQIMLQLGLIVGSFFAGYLPQTAYHFYTTGATPQTYQAKKLDWTIGIGTYICLRVSECLNPIFYNLASRKMRHETVSVLCKCCARPFTSKSRVSTSQATPKSSLPLASQSRDALEM
uniref:Growth hormone secretagogue receptor type 1-like n=1 Tax=Phallusia mammillata TaxID=59560 RepID=A0A6F9DDI4_9ASCI|nr:growth hormone secretagogue receptor type 1-like [Phallusia mammillata]